MSYTSRLQISKVLLENIVIMILSAAKQRWVKMAELCHGLEHRQNQDGHTTLAAQGACRGTRVTHHAMPTTATSTTVVF